VPDIGGGTDGGFVGLDGPWGAADPHYQVYRPDALAVAPRHGAAAGTLTGSTVPVWFNVEAARRWPAPPHSEYFGQALYLTPRLKKWMLYVPGAFTAPAAFIEQTPEQALAFLLREGHPVPPELYATRSAQEV
jgi:hypothetical protein